MINNEKLGNAIKEKRNKLGLSQEVVSRFADIGRTHLSSIERGERKPTLETFVRLAFALKMSPSELMKYLEEKDSILEG